MGSRVAIMNFIEAAKSTNIKTEILQTNGTFNFASSQTTTCREKMRVWFPTEPPCQTDFDIVEEGQVPLLFSLIQMRNLRFNIDLAPEWAYLTSPAIGAGVRLKMAPSRHLVLNLEEMKWSLPRMTKIDS